MTPANFAPAPRQYSASPMPETAPAASQKPALTAENLFNYAMAFARESDEAERNIRYPTFSQAAQHFKTSLVKIEEACADYIGDGYLRPAVGFRNHSGFGSYAKKGDWLVEAYD
jgi:hypothetical protein